MPLNCSTLDCPTSQCNVNLNCCAAKDVTPGMPKQVFNYNTIINDAQAVIGTQIRENLLANRLTYDIFYTPNSCGNCCTAQCTLQPDSVFTINSAEIINFIIQPTTLLAPANILVNTLPLTQLIPLSYNAYNGVLEGVNNPLFFSNCDNINANIQLVPPITLNYIVEILIKGLVSTTTGACEFQALFRTRTAATTAGTTTFFLPQINIVKPKCVVPPQFMIYFYYKPTLSNIELMYDATNNLTLTGNLLIDSNICINSLTTQKDVLDVYSYPCSCTQCSC